MGLIVVVTILHGLSLTLASYLCIPKIQLRSLSGLTLPILSISTRLLVLFWQQYRNFLHSLSMLLALCPTLYHRPLLLPRSEARPQLLRYLLWKLPILLAESL